MARPRSATSLNGVSEACALGGGACMRREQRGVLVDQRLDGGIEVGRRHVELVGSPDARGLHVGEVLEGRHHLQPGEIQRLPRPVGQLLLGIDLRAAFGQDGLECAEGLVVGGKGGGLVLAMSPWAAAGVATPGPSLRDRTRARANAAMNRRRVTGDIARPLPRPHLRCAWGVPICATPQLWAHAPLDRASCARN